MASTPNTPTNTSTPAARFTTSSGAAPCPCCGMDIMVNNISRPSKCDDCKGNRCKGETGGWHGE